MQRSESRLLPSCLLAAVMMVPSCRTAEEFLPPVIEQTPLVHDPTDAAAIAFWWSNGREMLHLQPDGRFALFGDQNRYHAPVRVGKWSRPSYAWIRLETYARFGEENIRAPLEVEGDMVALHVPEIAPMHSIARPPLVLEDSLLGEWAGVAGVLELWGDGRYELSPAPGSVDSPSVLPGHRGRWGVIDDALHLAPDPLNMDVFLIALDVMDDRIVLLFDGSALSRRNRE